MEKEEKENIRTHLPDLITYTICESKLLIFCYQKGVLSIGDIDKIAAIKEHIDKACAFYDIIQTKSDAYQVLKEALLLTDQKGIVEILENGFTPSTLEADARVRKILHDDHSDRKRIRLEASLQSPSTVPIFDVSAPVPLFTGRRKELEELHEKILRSAGNGLPTVISQLTSISGLGGIGKTQLSRQYVLEQQRQSFDGNCIWFDAETEDSLGESFRTLAKDRLEIKTTDANGSEKKISTVVSEVYRFFENRKSLFIFDNAERAAWFKQFLPVTASRAGISKPYILITSRTREWDKGIEVVDLNELNLDDAIELVKKGLGLEEDTSQDDDITKLVQRLQCFPLAIQQAISYIEDQIQTRKGYSIATYLEEFEKRQKELLSFDEMNNDILNDYNMTTLTVWTMTVEKIANDAKFGEMALNILYAMSYLAPEKIKREVFLRLEGIPNEEAMIGGIRLLARFSMIRGEDSLTLLSIHRLVQEVTRLELISREEEPIKIKNVLQMLSLPDGSIPSDNIRHMLATWQYVWKYPEVVRQFSLLPVKLVWKMHLTGKDTEPINFFKENKAKFVTILGEEHEHVLHLQHVISVCLLRQGMTQEALQTSLYVLQKRKSIFGEHDPRTLSTMNNLGRIYSDESRYEEALGYYEKAASVGRTTLPENDTNLIAFNQNLALNLRKLGRVHEALNIFKIVEQQHKANQNRAGLITVRKDLGYCLYDLDDLDGALKILQEDLENMTELSEEERIEMCALVCLTGKVLGKQGKHEEALQKHLQAYRESVDIFGDAHVEILLHKERIAFDLIEMGRYDEATSLLQDVSRKLEAVLGEDNFNVVRVKVLLVDALVRQGKDVGGAETIFNEQVGKIRGKGWEDLAFFKKDVCKMIERIEKDFAAIKI